MNKDIKLLIESFFDDMFDDHNDINDTGSLLLNNTSQEDQTHDLTVRTLYEPLQLTQCKTKEDIIQCYRENSSFIKWCENNLNDLIQYLKDNKSPHVFPGNINYIIYKRYKDLDDISAHTPDRNISEQDIFGLWNNYIFFVNLKQYKSYYVYTLTLQIRRTNSVLNNQEDLVLDVLYATDMDKNIIDDESIINEYKNSCQYPKNNNEMITDIIEMILPHEFFDEALNQINHTPKIYNISNDDIIDMMGGNESEKIDKLLTYKSYSKIVSKTCAYYLGYMDKFKRRGLSINWNSTTNLAQWCLGIHFLQCYIDTNKIKLPIYYSDLCASIKNYFENKGLKYE